MTDIKEIIQSPVFAKQKKKLHKQQIKNLDEAVKSVFNDPTIGDMKVGDLQGVQIYKFKSEKQQILLAYEVIDSTLYLYTFGSHENFYRKIPDCICSYFLHHGRMNRIPNYPCHRSRCGNQRCLIP